MIKFIGIILTVICTSFFFFPFEFSFLPGINTKLLLAILGLFVFVIEICTKRIVQLNKDFLILSFIAFFISLTAFVSITLNNTTDSVFVSYIISMWVWMSAAFMNLFCIKKFHKYLDTKIIINYLVVVCVIQCVLALTMGLYPPLKHFVDSFLGSEGFMGKVNNRFYGIGCALDVAGLRFCGVLIMIAHLSSMTGKIYSQKRIFGYVCAFFIILVLGNMISRTTLLGGIIAFLYVVFSCLILKNTNNIKELKTSFFILIVLCIPTLTYLYHNNAIIHDNLRFGFEGLFSLWELGEWKVTSNDILKQMIVFPDNLHSWIIGEGYFNNYLEDPYYIGKIYENIGFYRNTDIGYLRYIFYFGLIGLTLFILLFCKIAQICIKNCPDYRYMFLLILMMNFIGWFKVSSDLFPVFALFLVFGLFYKTDIESEQDNHVIE